MAVHAVIMAGGAGTRFWPASRELLPKQFLALGQDKSESLIEATVRRLSPLVSTETTWIATGAHLASITQKMLPNVPKTNILAEPVPRNTAPCVGWATWSIAARDSDALVMVLPSDHAVANEAEFVRLLRVALDAAARGYIGTLGIVPTRPETGYGYIEAGDPIFEGARLAKRFVEKPDRATAEAYAKSGAHLWNGGMFFFRASVMKDAIRTHLPELARVLDAIASQSESDEAVREHFPRAPKISIDHGVMERAERVAVVPGDFGWNDVGSWESAWELARKDGEGNALPAGAIAIDARRNLIWDQTTCGAKRVYAVVGVSDLVVVETDDAVLVLPRDRAQDVRAVVDELKRQGDSRT